MVFWKLSVGSQMTVSYFMSGVRGGTSDAKFHIRQRKMETVCALSSRLANFE